MVAGLVKVAQTFDKPEPTERYLSQVLRCTCTCCTFAAIYELYTNDVPDIRCLTCV